MADNLPLDYSCPHPLSLLPLLPPRDFTPPPPAHVPGNRCSSFATNRETLNARASTGFHPPQPLTPFPFSPSLSPSFPIRTNRLSSFSARKDLFSRLFHPFLGACGTAHERIYILYIYAARACACVYMYTSDDERRITRAREQRRHVHGGKLRPRSHIHRLAPRYSLRSWYVGILNALHTVTCRRHCSLHPSRLHLPPLRPPATPDSLPARPHQHALS